MPNKRDPDQQIVSVWMSSDLKRSLENVAKAAGLGISEFLRILIEKTVGSSPKPQAPSPKPQAPSPKPEVTL